MLIFLKLQLAKLKSIINKNKATFVMDEKSNTVIHFKNGSVIETISLNKPDTTRGHRSKFIKYYDDYENETRFKMEYECKWIPNKE